MFWWSNHGHRLPTSATVIKLFLACHWLWTRGSMLVVFHCRHMSDIESFRPGMMLAITLLWCSMIIYIYIYCTYLYCVFILYIYSVYIYLLYIYIYTVYIYIVYIYGPCVYIYIYYLMVTSPCLVVKHLSIYIGCFNPKWSPDFHGEISIFDGSSGDQAASPTSWCNAVAAAGPCARPRFV